MKRVKLPTLLILSVFALSVFVVNRITRNVNESSARLVQRAISPDGRLEVVVSTHGGQTSFGDPYQCLSICRRGDTIDDAIGQITTYSFPISKSALSWINDKEITMKCLTIPFDQDKEVICGIAITFVQD